MPESRFFACSACVLSGARTSRSAHCWERATPWRSWAFANRQQDAPRSGALPANLSTSNTPKAWPSVLISTLMALRMPCSARRLGVRKRGSDSRSLESTGSPVRKAYPAGLCDVVADPGVPDDAGLPAHPRADEECLFVGQALQDLGEARLQAERCDATRLVEDGLQIVGLEGEAAERGHQFLLAKAQPQFRGRQVRRHTARRHGDLPSLLLQREVAPRPALRQHRSQNPCSLVSTWRGSPGCSVRPAGESFVVARDGARIEDLA